jgi:hypothetical protein
MPYVLEDCGDRFQDHLIVVENENPFRQFSFPRSWICRIAPTVLVQADYDALAGVFKVMPYRENLVSHRHESIDQSRIEV